MLALGGWGHKWTNVYEYDVGFIGILFWLFNKKTCPKCLGKVKRKREIKLMQKRTNKGAFGTPAEYKVKHNFVCEDCGKEFTFNQVREQKWKQRNFSN